MPPGDYRPCPLPPMRTDRGRGACTASRAPVLFALMMVKLTPSADTLCSRSSVNKLTS